MDYKMEPVYADNGEFRYYDVVIENGRLQMVDGIEEIKNRLICNLMVFRGENFTDTTFGVDYHNNVFGRDVTDQVMIDEFKAAILKTRGVKEIVTFDITMEDRTAILRSMVKTTEGEVDLVTPITI